MRFSQWACIGRGHAPTSAHGGAIESALDEATAEMAKAKLFPMATTVDAKFKIKKAVQFNTTYLIRCVITNEAIKDVKYEITGTIYPIDTAGFAVEKEVLAVCVATMVNPAKLG